MMEMHTPPLQRVLVAGSAGFIGCNFVRFCPETRTADDIAVLDALTNAGNLATIGALIETGRVHFGHADIQDSETVRWVMPTHDIRAVVDFATESHADRSINDPGAFVETNVNGTLTLLNACRAAWQNADGWRADVRFHHLSTDEVYGSLMTGDAPFTERSPYAPNSPYAANKAASDHLVRAWMHTYGLPATISNCSNNYGPYHSPRSSFRWSS
jgi:dTDP-glucose 4,6-dehydratase